MGQPIYPPAYIVHDLCHAETKGKLTSKGELRVKCPRSSRPIWFEVNMAKGVWKCFHECSGCPINDGGGMLDFYRLFYDGSRADARSEIEKSIHGERGNLVERRKVQAIKPVELTNLATNKTRDKTYSALLEQLQLSRVHKNDLINRGFSPDDINLMGFKSVPQVGSLAIPKMLLSEGCTLAGVPGFYGAQGRFRLVCGTGYFIPYRDRDGKTIGLQIRHDINLSDEMTEEQVKEAKRKRYRWFTSSGEKDGTAAKNVPFYGIPTYPCDEVIFLTEGGLKAAAAQSITGAWFGAIPGTACYDAWIELLQTAREMGAKYFVDAFDRDRATNEHVARNIKKLYSLAEQQGITLIPWEWDAKHKGVDDFLLHMRNEKKSSRETIEVTPSISITV